MTSSSSQGSRQQMTSPCGKLVMDSRKKSHKITQLLEDCDYLCDYQNVPDNIFQVKDLPWKTWSDLLRCVPRICNEHVVAAMLNYAKWFYDASIWSMKNFKPHRVATCCSQGDFNSQLHMSDLYAVSDLFQGNDDEWCTWWCRQLKPCVEGNDFGWVLSRMIHGVTPSRQKRCISSHRVCWDLSPRRWLWRAGWEHVCPTVWLEILRSKYLWWCSGWKKHLFSLFMGSAWQSRCFPHWAMHFLRGPKVAVQEEHWGPWGLRDGWKTWWTGVIDGNWM